MTECNSQPLLFASLKGKIIQADFNGGHLTSDAGAALLREVDKRIGLIDAITNCIGDPLLQIVTDRGMNEHQPLASASTLCRFENRMDRKTLSKMASCRFWMVRTRLD
ncbi:MAG: transposase [Planctomycetota bacterium]|nr:transposase [Planctomycetota bacterium]